MLSNVTAAEAEDDRRAEIPESSETVLQLGSDSAMRPEAKFGVEDTICEDGVDSEAHRGIREGDGPQTGEG